MNQSLTYSDQAFSDTALVNHPEDNPDWYRQGAELANLGHYAEALVCFDQALAIRPEDHAAWVFRGVMLLHLGRHEAALESCNQALMLCPTDTEAWIFRGVALHRLGHYREAYASYERAVGATRDSFWLRSLRQLKRTRKLLKLDWILDSGR